MKMIPNAYNVGKIHREMETRGTVIIDARWRPKP